MRELHQLLEGQRFLQGIQFLALEVGDELLDAHVGYIAAGDDDDGGIRLDAPRRAIAPLAVKDTVADASILQVAILVHEERLQHPVLPDALGQLGESRLVEMPAWLARVGRELIERDKERVGKLRLGRSNGGGRVDLPTPGDRASRTTRHYRPPDGTKVAASARTKAASARYASAAAAFESKSTSGRRALMLSLTRGE